TRSVSSRLPVSWPRASAAVTLARLRARRSLAAFSPSGAQSSKPWGVAVARNREIEGERTHSSSKYPWASAAMAEGVLREEWEVMRRLYPRSEALVVLTAVRHSGLVKGLVCGVRPDHSADRNQRRPKSLPRGLFEVCSAGRLAAYSGGLSAGFTGGGGGNAMSAFGASAGSGVPASTGVVSSAGLTFSAEDSEVVSAESAGTASATFLMRESSNSRVILSLTSTPPESSFVFQVTPQSLRSMRREPSRPARRLPKGSVSMPMSSSGTETV